MNHITEKTKEDQIQELQEQFQAIITKGFKATIKEQKEVIRLGQQIEQLKTQIHEQENQGE